MSKVECFFPSLIKEKFTYKDHQEKDEASERFKDDYERETKSKKNRTSNGCAKIEELVETTNEENSGVFSEEVFKVQQKSRFPRHRRMLFKVPKDVSEGQDDTPEDVHCKALEEYLEDDLKIRKSSKQSI